MTLHDLDQNLVLSLGAPGAFTLPDACCLCRVYRTKINCLCFSSFFPVEFCWADGEVNADHCTLLCLLHKQLTPVLCQTSRRVFVHHRSGGSAQPPCTISERLLLLPLVTLTSSRSTARLFLELEAAALSETSLLPPHSRVWAFSF